MADEKKEKLIHLTLKKNRHGNISRLTVKNIPKKGMRTMFQKAFITSIPKESYDEVIKGTDMEDWFDIISEEKYKEIEKKFGVKAKKELSEKPFHTEVPESTQYHEADPVKQREYEILVSEGMDKQKAYDQVFKSEKRDHVAKSVRLTEKK